MRRILAFLILAVCVEAGAHAQSLDDLNIQIHGYATQSFVYTNNNNIFTMDSSGGSLQWTEAVVNVGATPVPKLRIGVQARYMLLGNIGNAITLDWAAADYKVNDRIGFRFGKVKTPTGLLNEIQDIDPSYQWALLPQGVYPLLSRNSVLSHEGGIVYGDARMGSKGGRLQYWGFAGVRSLPGNDGYFLNQTESGETLPNGISFKLAGLTLRWQLPIRGLMIGASEVNQRSASGLLVYGPYTGTQQTKEFNQPSYFGKYENDKLMVAGEYIRLTVPFSVNLTGLPAQGGYLDQRAWYAMSTYKATSKLSVGVYDTQSVDRASPVSSSSRRFFDWVINGRYDFNEFLYAKAEEHFMRGTEFGFDQTMNPNGLKPNTDTLVMKVGVSF